jgi:hypothetical protein
MTWEQGVNRVVQVRGQGSVGQPQYGAPRGAISSTDAHLSARCVCMQADEDADASPASSSGSDEPIDVIVRVRCKFNQTMDTQLALMVPKGSVQGELRRPDCGGGARRAACLSTAGLLSGFPSKCAHPCPSSPCSPQRRTRGHDPPFTS